MLVLIAITHTMKSIRWGILGTGKIAHRFAEDLGLLPDAELTAVGSRAQATAETFGDTFGISRCHASYEALVRDPEVDVIYVATPHPFHAAHARLGVEAGKAVLCEKPFTLNADEAAAIIEAARANRCFLMEAMWTRFLPIMQDMWRLMEQEAIGSPQLLLADIGERFPFDPEHRIYNPDLGGGALLDLGVYPVSFAFWVFGVPAEIQSVSSMGRAGVDEQVSVIFRYEDGPQAVSTASVRTEGARTATLGGSKGILRFDRPWWEGPRLTLTRSDDETTIARPYEGNGFQFEAAHVMRCLREGRQESPVMPLDESLQIMRSLDTIRAQMGLTYPGET